MAAAAAATCGAVAMLLPSPAAAAAVTKGIRLLRHASKTSHTCDGNWPVGWLHRPLAGSYVIV